MPTDKKLRSALLKRLKVTQQRLSQRVMQMKGDHGPMSAEDATYVIAHLEGLDLTRYLDASTVHRIRTIVPTSTPPPQGTLTTRRKPRARRQVLISVSPSLPQIDAFLSSTMATDAAKMAELYPKYYVLENSIRIVITRILEHKYGPGWWQTQVEIRVRQNVAKRKAKEKNQPWHGKRGRHEIFYSDFGDLKKIILRNWQDFKDLFPSQPWISQKLDELETPRNIMAHHNPVTKRDLDRIDVYFQDWVDLIQNRRDLIP